jgi:hypothetical protein
VAAAELHQLLYAQVAQCVTLVTLTLCRQVYCCDTCQPLQRVASPAAHHADSACATPVGKKKGRGVRSPAATAAAEVADAAADAVAATLLTPARLKSMAAARVAKVCSHLFFTIACPVGVCARCACLPILAVGSTC